MVTGAGARSAFEDHVVAGGQSETNIFTDEVLAVVLFYRGNSKFLLNIRNRYFSGSYHQAVLLLTLKEL